MPHAAGHDQESAPTLQVAAARRRWRVAALLAATLLPVAALLAALPVKIATPGPALPVHSVAGTYSTNLHVPTVYFNTEPAFRTILCRLQNQCQTVQVNLSQAQPSNETQAASTVDGVSQSRLRQAPPASVDAVGTSSQLAKALYYVTYAAQTPLQCSVAATGSVNAAGDVLPVTAVRMKELSAATIPIDILFTPGSGPATVRDGYVAVPVRTVQQAYDYLRWTGCLNGN